MANCRTCMLSLLDEGVVTRQSSSDQSNFAPGEFDIPASMFRSDTLFENCFRQRSNPFHQPNFAPGEFDIPASQFRSDILFKNCFRQRSNPFHQPNFAPGEFDIPASMQVKKKARQFVAPKPPKEDGGEVQASFENVLKLTLISGPMKVA